MPGCDSPRCRSSCGVRAQRPPCQIDSLKSARPITIPLVDYQYCGALRNRRSIAWGKTGTTMGATRGSISACPLLSPSHPGLKNRRQLLQPTELTAANPIAQLEHKDRPCQQQRDGIGQNDRPGMEDQSI